MLPYDDDPDGGSAKGLAERRAYARASVMGPVQYDAVPNFPPGKLTPMSALGEARVGRWLTPLQVPSG